MDKETKGGRDCLQDGLHGKNRSEVLFDLVLGEIPEERFDEVHSGDSSPAHTDSLAGDV